MYALLVMGVLGWNYPADQSAYCLLVSSSIHRILDEENIFERAEADTKL